MAIGTLFTLIACEARPPEPKAAGVSVAPGVTLTIPTATQLPRRMEVSQLVVARYGTQTISFEAHISVTPDHFDLVCIDLLGRETVRIHWTSAGIEAHQAAWVPELLHPENMLADIIMLYWPAAVVTDALAASGGILRTQANRRSVWRGDKEIIRADYQLSNQDDLWNGKAHFHNFSWDYELNIQSQAVNL